MTSRGPYPRHSTPFRLQPCQDVGLVLLVGAMRSTATTSRSTSSHFGSAGSTAAHCQAKRLRPVSSPDTKPASPRWNARRVSLRWSWILGAGSCKNIRRMPTANARRTSSVISGPAPAPQAREQSHEPAAQRLCYCPAAQAEGLTDADLTSIIEDIQDELPCYDYKRVTHGLRRQGFIINHKRVARVMRCAGLSMKPRRRL